MFQIENRFRQGLLSRVAIVLLELVNGIPLYVHSELSTEWKNLVEAHNEQSGDAASSEIAER